uniref:Phosphorylated adapter RNA export protein n=2 Tax=Timema TaxID=61471 RepID=A0A7R9D671_TIMCR|nr:unnamed protein product [Timema cristinae]
MLSSRGLGHHEYEGYQPYPVLAFLGAVAYTPLERPSTATKTQDIKYSDSEEENNSADSDSNSDSDSNPKRPKLKKPGKAKGRPNSTSRPSQKYNVWSADVQENSLVDELESCGMKKKKFNRDLGVESYNLPFSITKPNKMRSRGSSRGYKRHWQDTKVKDPSPELSYGDKRELPDLQKTVDSDANDLAQDIANKLCETKDDLGQNEERINPLHCHRVGWNCLVRASKRKAKVSLSQKTTADDGEIRVRSRSGLMRKLDRRRTPGGVYFQLVKQSALTREQNSQIFGEPRQFYIAKKRANAQLRKQKAEELRRTLSADNLLPGLKTRAELTLDKIKKGDEIDGEPAVRNPPPSPATDGKDNSSDGVPDISDDTDTTNDEEGETTVITVQDNDSQDCQVVNVINPVVINPVAGGRELTSYDDDFLDLGCDMDTF